MICEKHGGIVFVGDCEECISQRVCAEICAKRGFVFGRKDNLEPLWEFSRIEAQNIEADLIEFFNDIPNPAPPIKSNLLYIPYKQRWRIWERDNFTCQICGIRRYLSIDHIFPRALGGSDDDKNLQTLCVKCNSQKSSKV